MKPKATTPPRMPSITRMNGRLLPRLMISGFSTLSIDDTTSAPQNMTGASTSYNENVIGWGDLAVPPAGSAYLSGVTYTSSQDGKLVDADLTFSAVKVTDAATLQRVAVQVLQLVQQRQLLVLVRELELEQQLLVLVLVQQQVLVEQL